LLTKPQPREHMTLAAEFQGGGGAV